MCAVQEYDWLASAEGASEIIIPARQQLQLGPLFVPIGKSVFWKLRVKNFDIKVVLKERAQGDEGSVERNIQPECLLQVRRAG